MGIIMITAFRNYTKSRGSPETQAQVPPGYRALAAATRRKWEAAYEAANPILGPDRDREAAKQRDMAGSSVITLPFSDDVIPSRAPRSHRFSIRAGLAGLALIAAAGLSCDNTIRDGSYTPNPEDIAGVLSLAAVAYKLGKSSSDITSEKVLVYGRDSLPLEY